MKYQMTKHEFSDKTMYLVIGVLSAITFCLIYGIAIINPTYTDWLLKGSGDLAQHYLGWKAYRNSSWYFPVGMFDTLSYPNKASIIFTDSIPLFAVFFKFFSPILPENFQYFGMWGIMCFVLQGILSARILKNYVDNKLLVIISSIIFLFAPIMLFRMYLHTSLAGQWILMLGLELIFSYKKYRENKKIYFMVALIAFFSASVHVYFVLMSGFIMVGVCVLDVLYYKRKGRSMLVIATYLLIAAVTIALLGGFSSGMQAGTDGLGIHSFNLNAFFNPQGWSCIYRDLALYGNGQYEGLAYLGAGVLLYVIVALISFGSHANAKYIIAEHWKEAVALVVPVVLSVAVAVSPVVTFGDNVLIELKLPDCIVGIWSIFRASGRVVWISVYIIMFASCIIAYKMFNKRGQLILFSICLLVQIYDIHEMLIQKKDYFSEAYCFENAFQKNDLWNNVAQNRDIKHLVYFSSVEDAIMYPITDWALDNQKTINSFHFARPAENLIKESRTAAFSELSKEDIFVFRWDERLNCLKYDLNYYQSDGLIVGYVNEIQGAVPMDINDFILEFSFGDAELCSGDFSYVPYWTVPEGKYKLTVRGENLADNVEFSLHSLSGLIDDDSLTISNVSDTEILITLSLNENMDYLEVHIKNNSKNSIRLECVSMEAEQVISE